MQNTVSRISERLQPAGLRVLGVFDPDGDGMRNGVMIGNTGSAMWQVFDQARRDDAKLATAPEPLDQWTRRILRPVAAEFDAIFHHPSDGPPWQPFQRWARACGCFFQSPLGLNIHPEFGLWSALRGALVLPDPVEHPHGDFQNPCDTCPDQPCLSACPVGAFDATGYDAQACRRELRGTDRQDCMTRACAARRACPLGREWQYEPVHAAFHMQAFRAGFIPDD